MTRARETDRRRLALSAIVAGLFGGLAYVLDRAYFHLIAGGGVPAIVVREATIGYHLALWIAAFVGVLAGLLTAELVRSESSLGLLEGVLERVALPLVVALATLTFVFP